MRRPSLTSIALCALAAALGGGAAEAAVAASPGPGLHPLWRIPARDLAGADRVARGGTVALGAFRLPPGSAQGPTRWYAIRLRAELRLTRAPGFCILSAATDRATAAQIELRTGPRGAAVSSLGWIQGRRRLVTQTGRARIDFRNYLQVHGVQAGANPLTLTLELLHGRCLKGIRLLPGSGIATTAARPDELRFLVPTTVLTATKGHALTIPYELSRRGGWPDRGATVTLTVPRGWRLDGPGSQRFARLHDGRRGAFRITPTTTGTSFVGLRAMRVYNEPNATIQVQVEPAKGWLRSRGVSLVLSATLIVGAAALTLASRRAKQRVRVARRDQTR
ncbi:MAG: hypothetical protein ACTHOE_01235 [Conexibacter sp.]